MSRQDKALKGKKIVTVVATKNDLRAYEYMAEQYYSSADIDLIESNKRFHSELQESAEDWEEGLV